MTLPYTQLSLAERREIARMHAAKIPIRVIAERLQRHRSTIYREIKRNWFTMTSRWIAAISMWPADLNSCRMRRSTS